jgi:hypothetical protein
MSSFLREADHGIFYAQSLLAHWAARGARVLNGADVLAIDSSKARSSRSHRPGPGVPETRVVHRPDDLVASPEPCATRAGQGQYRRLGRGHRPLFRRARTGTSVRDATVPTASTRSCSSRITRPRRGGVITRIETLGGKFLYAIEVESGGDSFDLCPPTPASPPPARRDPHDRASRPARDRSTPPNASPRPSAWTSAASNC